MTGKAGGDVMDDGAVMQAARGQVDCDGEVVAGVAPCGGLFDRCVDDVARQWADEASVFGDGHEVVGWDQSMFRVDPAYERFDAADLPGRQVELGLVKQYYLTVGDRAAQFADEPEAFRAMRVMFGVVQLDDAVTSFRDVHGDVGMFHQGILGVAMIREHRDSDARLDLEVEIVDQERLVECLRETQRDSDGLTDAYELLVSHTNPSNADTDGDGIPDGWEVAHGLNPLVNDAGEDPDDDGVTNYQEYQGNTNPFDNMLIIWGDNLNGQSTLPWGFGPVAGMAGGGSLSSGGHTLVLKNETTVVAFGANYYSQTNVPTNLSNVVAVVAGGDQSAALKSDGTVVT